MDKGSMLEIDVNGEEGFLTNQGILFSYSSKLRNLLRRSTGEKKNDDISPPPSSSSSASSSAFSTPCTLHSGTLMETNSNVPSSSPSPPSSSSSEKILSGIPIWIEDLTTLDAATAENLTKQMISHKINHPTIAKFLLHYLKSKQNSSTEEKKKTVETVIDFLFFLESSPTTCKSLFGIHHFAFGLKIAKSSRAKLEKMIGGKLDEASLDNLLVPGARGMYDVDLVLRLVRVFVSERSSSDRMKKVAALVDAYMGEIAPEKSLKREKFVGMLRALPDGARTSYDGVYRAVDVFLQVHSGLVTDEEREKICAAVDYSKLSPTTCSHLAGNSRFPPWAAVRAITAGQSKIKTLLRAAEEREQIVIYARKMEVFPAEDTEKMRAHLRGMQWKVAELEKICRKMQTQMRKVAVVGGRRTLPFLCS